MKIFNKINLKKVGLYFTLTVMIIITALVARFYSMLSYNEHISENLTKDVIVINDYIVSIYLVKSDSGYIAIDTGYFESFVEEGLRYNHISKDSIKYMLITHSDPDHVSLIKIFKNAKVYFPEKEKRMLEEKKTRFSFLPFYSSGFNVNGCTFVNDGDELSLDGKSVRCISLPGHTDGSMGYIIDNKYLFVGDAFRIKNGKISEPNLKWVLMNLEQMRNSLKKVAKLENVQYIFSSNSGFTANFKFAVSDIKQTNLSPP